MDAAADIGPDRRERALAALAEKPDGIVEAIAANADVTPAEILEILPTGSAVVASKENFLDIWSELTTWGVVLFLVHTEDVVAEIDGELPVGSESHGWFNIHGDSPIGGHIKKDNCASITFVDRAFHGRRSCSIWFMNTKGSAMFKIFVHRDENRELEAGQLIKFEQLRSRYSSI